ncbi:MAG TPA: diguanylate cyclase [Rhizomicrobium sp.]|jgi:diguanylate cyclase|nr:diguanylate cyclase [Rhizomicrobium sp.]
MNRHERAQALAKTALAVMAERQVAPTPENYQLFYAYAAGENPAVARVIGDMVAGKRPFPPDVLDDLRQRFFPAAREEKATENLGAGIQGAMKTAMDTLQAAGRDTVAYGRTLSEASGELDTDHSPEDIRKLVEGLRGATVAMEQRTKELEGKLQESSHEIGELKSKLDNIRKESLTDPLTGIANRKAFDTELAQAMAQARESGEPLSLVMCDIDKFKNFNDSWGHQTGDQVLRLVAHCLSENVKGRDTAARYGGEEFAVILRQTPRDSAVMLANQIRNAVESKKLVKKSTGDILGTITISGGVAELTPADSAASFIQRADECLYAAKNAGRNCIIAENAAAKADAA